MNFFRKRCTYCERKIEKGQEFLKEVKDPVFIGTKEKTFCCSEHAKRYEEKSSCCKKSSGGCCG